MQNKNIILGLNYNHPDSSASLLINGELIAAVEEERFTRIKHFSNFPLNSIDYCLKAGNIKMSEVDIVALNFDPKENFIEKIKFSLLNIFSYSTIKKVGNFYKNKFKKNDLAEYLARNEFKGVICNFPHHKSHFASSLALSDFDECMGLTIDGFGDFCSTESFFYKNKKICSLKKVFFPHSLGIFYQAVTQYLGFKNYGDEYKVMGLASYGKPSYLEEFNNIIHFDPENFFKLNLKYFNHHKDSNFKYVFTEGNPKFDDLYSNKLVDLFGPERSSKEELKQHHMDIASSMQVTFENIVIKILNQIYEENNVKNICLSGGCALNSKFNGIIRKKTPFENVVIQPNAGDGGGSFGAAQLAQMLNENYENKKFNNQVYLGPQFSNREIESHINAREDLKDFKIKKLEDDELYIKTAEQIYKNKVIGWFKGRMEWGPRALGNRSILANPSNKNIKDILNLKIKLREKFRPFAPAILFDDKEEYFDLNYHSPFMLNVVQGLDKAKEHIPSTVHVDGTCRVQTVKKDENMHFYNLISAFKKISGIPILLNTSFNENEPIVLSPKHAIDCFVRTKMDFLVLENWTISRCQ